MSVAMFIVSLLLLLFGIVKGSDFIIAAICFALYAVLMAVNDLITEIKNQSILRKADQTKIS